MNHEYTSAFGAILDDEISGAIRAGMPIERVYTELMDRVRMVQAAVVEKHQQREQVRCDD